MDFKAVKHAVSMEMALAYYGVMLRRLHGPCLRGRCPLPSHASRGSVQSLIVDTEKNAWACHSGSCVASRGGRTGGNVLDFVAAMERCSVRDAALKLQEWFALAARPAPRGQIVSAAEALHISPHTDIGESNKPLPFTLWDIDLRHPYLSERRVDSKTAANFGVGFYPGKGSMEGRIVYPDSQRRRDFGGLCRKEPRSKRTEVQVPRALSQIARSIQSAPRYSPWQGRYRRRRVL